MTNWCSLQKCIFQTQRQNCIHSILNLLTTAKLAASQTNFTALFAHNSQLYDLKAMQHSKQVDNFGPSRSLDPVDV